MRKPMKMEEILRKYTGGAEGTSDLALVIGNGINIHNGSEENSWQSLLKKLSDKYLNHLNLTKIPKGISLTEFYDILELSQDTSGKKPQEASDEPLQKQFHDPMGEWPSHCHHKRIAAWAKNNNVPVLTTNFDNTLGKAIDCTLRRITDPQQRFTDYYPWNSYYGLSDLGDPCSGFGIWHVNGLGYYYRSIRLGLSHYMGSVQRARGWIHGEESLFSSKTREGWHGSKTWLHIVFNKNLLFFGIGMEENEIFLRWLLIQRERYFQVCDKRGDTKRRKRAWYIYTDERNNKCTNECTDECIKSGKLFFLKNVGVVPIKVCNHDCIYSSSMFPC